jgi:hypothetical protein
VVHCAAHNAASPAGENLGTSLRNQYVTSACATRSYQLPVRQLANLPTCGRLPPQWMPSALVVAVSVLPAACRASAQKRSLWPLRPRSAVKRRFPAAVVSFLIARKSARIFGSQGMRSERRSNA